MICKVCLGEGKKSTVTDLGGTTTMMHTPTFYAEDGSGPHRHDTNRRMNDYKCSNGHRWTEQKYSRCSACAWTNAPRTYSAPSVREMVELDSTNRKVHER